MSRTRTLNNCRNTLTYGSCRQKKVTAFFSPIQSLLPFTYRTKNHIYKSMKDHCNKWEIVNRNRYLRSRDYSGILAKRNVFLFHLLCPSSMWLSVIVCSEYLCCRVAYCDDNSNYPLYFYRTQVRSSATLVSD